MSRSLPTPGSRRSGRRSRRRCMSSMSERSTIFSCGEGRAMPGRTLPPSPRRSTSSSAAHSRGATPWRLQALGDELRGPAVQQPQRDPHRRPRGRHVHVRDSPRRGDSVPPRLCRLALHPAGPHRVCRQGAACVVTPARLQRDNNAHRHHAAAERRDALSGASPRAWTPAGQADPLCD